MKKHKKLFLVIVLVCAQIIGCALPVKQNNERPNIILIINDSLRADRLGCYGYGNEISPNIDKLAHEGALFTNAISQAGYTLPSIASILTSKSPLAHGAYTQYHRLGNEENTLAEILKRNGYKTVAFVGGGYTSKIYGLDQGFDIYEETYWGRIEEVNGLAFDWLKNNKDKPFFLMLHHYTTHDPYEPPKPFSRLYADVGYKGIYREMFLNYLCLGKINKGELKVDKADIQYIISQYDGDVSNCDQRLGELFKLLKDLNLYSNSIIILTADHGEDLMEHNTFSHGDIYDQIIRIPLIFRYPHMPAENRKIDSDIEAIDIFPTVLDILQINIQKYWDIEGSSFLPLLLGGRGPGERLIFSLGHDIEKNMRISLRSQDFKIVFVLDKRSWFLPASKLEIERVEFYNLKKDPEELVDCAYTEPERCLDLKRKLLKYLDTIDTILGKNEIVMDEGTRSRLKSLGYLQ